ncbi:ATP-binding protein [Plantactinospora sonchi]|uniref:NB-ARC domain-containing protein n=1 Tax=Plantactinospora sonchi TaxID=1544735 RepID=A0ABU7RSS7_9ACTN
MSQVGISPPRPDGITTALEFVAGLRRLRLWSGLTYRQIAARAHALGSTLPASTFASVLGRSSLPRREVVAIFGQVCGLDESSVGRWVQVRDAVAGGLLDVPPGREGRTHLPVGHGPTTQGPAVSGPTAPGSAENRSAQNRSADDRSVGNGPAAETPGPTRPTGSGPDGPTEPALHGATGPGSTAPVGPGDDWVVPAMLPPDIPDFTGRLSPVSALRELLTDSDSGQRTALTVGAISGMGGAGKTTLAVHVGQQVRNEFPDGQLYVNLRGAEAAPLDPAEVLARFLRAVGVPGRAVPADPVERTELYRTRLAGRRVLVLLDNAASVEQVRPLLPGTASCAVLVTSRTPLTSLPSGLRVDLAVLTDDEAVAMLARIIGPGRVAGEPAQATGIARLCGHLPLAVRIAGGRLAGRPGWPIARLAALLGDERRRLDRLATGDLAVRASIGLSYHGLDEQSRRLFRRLSLFDAPDFPSWMAALLVGCSVDEVTDQLEALVDAQLLTIAGPDPAGQLRYRFHDLVRLFGRREAETHRLTDRPGDVLLRGLGGWLAVAEEMASGVPGPCYAPIHGALPRPGVDWSELYALRADPTRWFEAERAVLLALIRQACRLDLDEAAFGLAGCLEKYFDVRGMYADWAATNTEVMTLCRERGNLLGEAVMLRGLIDVSTWAMEGQDGAAATAVLHREASRLLEMFTRLGHRAGMSDASVLHAWARAAMGDQVGAVESARLALRWAEDSAHPGGQVRAHLALAMAHAERRDFGTGVRHLSGALRQARALGNPRCEATVLQFVGIGQRELGEYQASQQALDRSLAICRTHRDTYTEALTLLALARLYLVRGDRRARSAAEASLAIGRRHSMRHHVAEALGLRGEIELVEGRPARAVAHLEESVAIWRTRGWLSFQAAALTNLGRAHLGTDASAARSALTEARDIFRDLGDDARVGELSALLDVAAVHGATVGAAVRDAATTSAA